MTRPTGAGAVMAHVAQPVGEDAETGERIDLPRLALSIRQPWAWAILHAGKDLENRTLHSIRLGGMRSALGQMICIHAAQGMTTHEYDWANRHIVRANPAFAHIPEPKRLPRGAIVGVARIVDVITKSTSPWFIGPAALRLAEARAIVSIPSRGALGLFKWEPAEERVEPLPWMLSWPDPPARQSKKPTATKVEEPSLFPVRGKGGA